MKISVVTPSYNQAQFLEECLRSVHAQSGDFDLEHIVVDGGSDDGSVELLERWRHHVQFTSKPDRGQSHALNMGVARANGDIIVWLNSDDLLLPGSLATVAEVFERNPHARWMTGRCRIVDERGREIRKPITLFKNLLLSRYCYSSLLLENYISQPATFFRRDLFEQAYGVNESLHFTMDYDLFLRFGLLCEPAVVDRYLACFRLYRESKSGSSIDETLRVAHQLSAQYARLAGKPWLGKLNYWLYYRRTSAIYRLLERLSR